ncbi:MAG: endonuclease/exonuclease/phosphatase family protein [Prolixibacteraceae bacterium]|jgi:endonuclease/exonuclease/phosphatase family metal-dependent hydrolase|nr:endonuclease/exonuclease/phosphatase family protein [Prolixibacteraceae bacterium]
MNSKRIFFLLIAIQFILFIPQLQAQESKSNEPVKLKILCYNLRFGELASLEELAGFIKSQNPDIVALQEVDVKTHRPRAPHQNGKDFITELGFRTGMLTAYAKTIPHEGGYYGIGILSKFPFVETRRIMLPYPEGAKEQRAMLYSNIELDNGQLLTFVCTHLDYTISSVRQEQVKALNEELKGNPYPMIVCGDFNAKPGSPEISQGMAAWKQVTNSDFTVPANAPKSKIDYIFCFPGEQWKCISTETPRVALSDHLPVNAELELGF